MISSPVLDYVFKRGWHLKIYILCVCVCRLHGLTILTKYYMSICSLTHKCELVLTLNIVRSHTTMMNT